MAVFGGVAVGPPLLEPAPAEQALEMRERVGAVGRDGVGDGVVRPRAGVLDVDDVAPEAAEPLEVVEHLPGDARERRHAHHAEDDNAGLHPTTAPDSDWRWA